MILVLGFVTPLNVKQFYQNNQRKLIIDIIFCSCLKALRVLQVNSHVPPDPAAFEYYAR